MGRLRHAAVPPIVLGLVVLAAFARLVAQPAGLLVDARRPSIDEFIAPEERAPGNDLTRLFLPLHLRVGGWVRTLGRVPGWDPIGFGGRPLIGNPQASLWYPPVWLVWLSAAPAALGWLTVAHLAFGAIGTYRLGRDARLSSAAALVAGGGFALAPYGMAQMAEGHLPHVWAASFYPWIFLAQRHWRRGDRRGALALPVMLAASALAGHYQETFYLLIVLLIWILFDTGRGLIARDARSLGRLAAWLMLVVLAGALAAVEWMPARALGPWLVAPSGVSLSEAGKYHWHPANLLQLLHPLALGGAADYFGHVSYWETLLSFGWFPLALAGVAVAASDRRREVRGWASLAVGSILFAAGPGLGVFTALYYLVPGMDHFRVPARALFLAGLGMAVLSGIGFDAVLSGGERLGGLLAHRYRQIATALAGLVILGAVAAGGLERSAMAPESGEPTGRVGHRLSEGERLLRGGERLAREPGFWLPLAAFGLFLDARQRNPRIAGPVALSLLALLDLAVPTARRVVVTPAATWTAPDPIAQAIHSRSPDRPYRVRARETFYDDLRAVVAGFETTNLQDQFQIRHAADLYETLYSLPGPPTRRERRFPEVRRRYDTVRVAVLERMNTTFLINDEPLDRLGWPRVPVPGDDRAALYENPDPLPRAHVVPRVEIHSDDASTVHRFPAINPREAVLMRTDPLRTPGSARQPFTPARCERPAPDRVRVQVTTREPGLLVIRDTWMPGWTARGNEQLLPILRGDRAWRVIPLPDAGSHRIEMTYHPPALARAAAITAAGGGAWLALLFLVGREREPRPRGNPARGEGPRDRANPAPSSGISR